MERCDVLVVGGGPAGSSTALGLRYSGLDVLLLDRADFPRDKPCAGWVTPSVLTALGIDADRYAAAHTFQPITGFRIRRIGDREASIGSREPISYGILRCEFDHYLLERCGARLRLGERVHSIDRDPSRERWVVNGAIEARILIGAGGHFCPVARHVLSDREPREIAILAQEAEYELTSDERTKCAVDPSVPEIYYTADLEGYGWIFRKGNHLNVGLGRRDPTRLQEHVARFIDYLCAEGRLRAAPASPLRGHSYLLYEDAHRPIAGDGFALVGDAAGLAYARSGEGIRPAVESGLLAARVIAREPQRHDSAHLDAYRAELEARFGRRRDRAGLSLTDLLPAAWTQKLAGLLLANPRFARRVVVDRWFLRADQAPLAPIPRAPGPTLIRGAGTSSP